MPALPPVPNVIRVRAVWTIMGKANQGARWFYLYSGSAPTTAALGTFGGLLQTQYLAHMVPNVNAGVTLTEWVLEDLSISTGAVAVVASNTPGTAVNNNISPATSVVTVYEVARRYRGGRPKTFWPPPGEDAIGTNGLFTPGFVSTFQTAQGNVIQAPVAATAGGTTITNHVNVSYYEGFTVVTEPISGRARNAPKLRSSPLVEAVVGATVQPYVGSMRRRRG